MDRYVKGEVVAILESLDNYGQLVGVLLIGSDEWGDRVLPIIVGSTETLSIKKGLGETNFPRPLTHDLFMEVLETLGVTIEKITIDSMISGTYTATLYIRDNNGKVYSFDSRPSDAVALAIRANAPIYVSETLYQYTEDSSVYLSRTGGKISEE